MAGIVLVTEDLVWPATYSGLHWVGEFLFNHLEDPEAKEYVREALDHNLGSIALSELPSGSRLQALHFLRSELVEDAQRRLKLDPVSRENYLNSLRELEEMANKALAEK